VKTFYVTLVIAAFTSTVAGAEPAAVPHGGLAPALSGHPPPPTPASPDAKILVTGTVLETMNAAGYTYVRVNSADGEMWAAGPQTAVKVGDAVSFPRGMAMKNFHSDKLDRTFESIAFVNSITVGTASAEMAAAAPAKPDPHGGLSTAGAEGMDVSGIARPEGGKTVGEIFDQQDELSGKEIMIRAKVVKVNRGIMGRNWLHLRDGTKSSTGADDLTITSSDAADVGKTVLVRGRVSVNKDFGFGYHYDVVVEDATITAE